MVRYSPSSLSFLVVYLALLTRVNGAPAGSYPVVNVDGGSSAAETVPITEVGYVAVSASEWGEDPASTVCSAISTETIEKTTTITIDQQTTITKTSGIISFITDYQTVTLSEYYTITPHNEAKTFITVGHENTITETVEVSSRYTEYKTLTVTEYHTPSTSTATLVTATPSYTTDKTTTVTVTAAPSTITETISLTSTRTDKEIITTTQYVTATPETMISNPLATVLPTPTSVEQFTTVYVTHYSYLSPTILTIVRTATPTISTAVTVSSESLSVHTLPSLTAASHSAASSHSSSVLPSTSVPVTVTASPSSSSSAELVTVTVTELAPFSSLLEPVTVTVTESETSLSPVAFPVESSTPVTAIVTTSVEVASTITVTQPGETYTVIIDRSTIVTNGHTAYVTEYRAQSPSLTEAFSTASSSSSSNDGASSTASVPSAPTFPPRWTNTTALASLTSVAFTETISPSKSARNGTFFT
ncbi:hypothetical protein V1517DRAFT_320526 [Lipomyces orientalis]|uniref:Uncharacterized protein n=1 Tax=Lipomyces orientalis TaxID=1233043 RepID=A0ACC3TQU3_9ASCO